MVTQTEIVSNSVTFHVIISYQHNCGRYPACCSRCQSYINIIDITYSVLNWFQVYHNVDGHGLDSADTLSYQQIELCMTMTVGVNKIMVERNRL